MSDSDLELSKAAIDSIVSSYDGLGEVHINIVQFYNGATINSGWITADEVANLTLDNTQHGTDIVQGLRGLVEDSYSGNEPQADQNMVYFFGDGNTYGDYRENFDAYTGAVRDGGDVTMGGDNPWTDFITSGAVDKFMTYSVNTNGVLKDIAHLADNGESVVSLDPIAINDISDLGDVLQNSVSLSQSGEFTTDVDGNPIIAFGADGGHITSVVLDGHTVTYDADHPIQSVDGKYGTFDIDFDTGTYRYFSSDENLTDHTEHIVVEVVDGDGDGANGSVELTINVTYDESLNPNRAPDAVDDTIDVTSNIGDDISINLTVVSTNEEHTSTTGTNTGGIFAAANALTGLEDIEEVSDNTTLFSGNLDGNRVYGSEDNNVHIQGNMNGHIDLGDGDNYLEVDTNSNQIIVGDGDDTINIDGNQNANIDLGAGDNRLDVDGNSARIYMGDGDDSIRVGGNANKGLDLNGGDNILDIKGNANNIYADGGGDNTILVGGHSNGTIDLGTGDDIVRIGGNTNGNIALEDGDDTLIVQGTTNKRIYADEGDDSVYIGGRVNDFVVGGDGIDSIVLDNYNADNWDSVSSKILEFENIKLGDGTIIGDASAFESQTTETTYTTTISVTASQDGTPVSITIPDGVKVVDAQGNELQIVDSQVVISAGTDVSELKLVSSDELSSSDIDSIEGSISSANSTQADSIVIDAADILANDSDPEGNPITITEVTASADTHGTVEIGADGNIIFTPDSNYSGEASFEYTISDGKGGEDTAKVNIQGVNEKVILEESFENLQTTRGWHVEKGDGGDVTGDHGVVWDTHDSGVEIQNGIVAASSDGDAHAELDAHGSISNVTMSTTVSLGSSSEYTMSFDIQPRDGGASRDHKDTSDMRVTFGGREMTISSDSDGNLTVDGDSSISIVTHAIDDGWTRVEARYDGVSGNESELLIEGTGAEDTYGMLLDNIKIVSSASVSITVEGTDSDDTLIANDTIDRYSSGDGDDVIYSGSRDDHIDGGAGTDRVVYSGNRDDYDIFKSLNDKYVIEDKRADAKDGTDTVVNVEKFTFADGTLDQANLEATNRAIVVDGIIGGLEYTTSSGLTGYTQDDGSFDYLDGDTVTFKLGSVTIGDIDMSDISDEQVFLQDIANVDRTDMNDEYVENMVLYQKMISKLS